MKTVYRVIGIILMALILSSLCPSLPISEEFIRTLFTVVGIMFSVSMSILIGFNTTDIYNERFLNLVRLDLRRIRRYFIMYFVVSVLLYITFALFPDLSFSIKWIQFRFAIFVATFESFTILYYIYNLIKLGDLNDKISDKIKEEKRRH